MKTLSHVRPLKSHFTLPFRLRTPGNLYLTRHLLRWYQSQEFPITSTPDISSALLHDVFPETRILLFKLNPTCKFYACSLHLCRYFQIHISLFSPCTGNLGKQQVNEFGKHPTGKSPVIQGRLLLLLLVLLSTTLQMLSRMGCLLGIRFEVPVPGDTFLRSCLGLWPDPSGTFLAQKKWTHFTDNWSHKALKNYSYFYNAKAKWVFLARAFHISRVIGSLWFCHTSLQRQLRLG